MKRLFFVASIALLASCSGDKEKNIAASEVPAAVTTAFTGKYPTATDVKWERETEDAKTVYEAEFKLNDKKTEAFWDESGTFIREDAD